MHFERTTVKIELGRIGSGERTDFMFTSTEKSTHEINVVDFGCMCVLKTIFVPFSRTVPPDRMWILICNGKLNSILLKSIKPNRRNYEVQSAYCIVLIETDVNSEFIFIFGFFRQLFFKHFAHKASTNKRIANFYLYFYDFYWAKHMCFYTTLNPVSIWGEKRP